jgi:ribulose kinase
MPLACPETNRGMQMHFSARACYIASAVCAAVAEFAFFGVANESEDRSLQMQPTTTTRRLQTTSAATRLERVEDERTRLANELRNAHWSVSNFRSVSTRLTPSSSRCACF